MENFTVSMVSIKYRRIFTFFATVDELSCVHSLDGNEVLLPCLEPVGITEVNNSQGGSTTRIVDDVLKK